MSGLVRTALSSRTQASLYLLAAIRRQISIRRSRKALALLDDHLLRDVGLTRSEADAEASRRTWDAPLHWRG